LPQLQHDPVLPSAYTALPARAQELVRELIRFACWLAVHQQRTQQPQVCFHMPQWLIIDTLGISEDTMRRYLAHPLVQRLIRAVPHYADGYYHRLITGKIFAVVLDPNAPSRPRILFEPDEQLRDLEHDARHGRVRGSYKPSKSKLSEVLQEWYLSAGPVAQPQASPSVDDPRRPVDKLWNALRDLRIQRSRAHVTRAARAIVAFTEDRPAYLPGWCALLWRVSHARSTRPYDQLCALLARHSDDRSPQRGRLLLATLRLAGA
jgi:hypothetical protein